MSLYKKLKDHLPEVKASISDEDFILLDRKDYHLSQLSATHAVLGTLGAKCNYSYRVLLSLLEQFSQNIPTRDFNIVLTEPGLTLGALMIWIRAGGTSTNGMLYVPNAMVELPSSNGPLGEMIADLKNRTVGGPRARPSGERLDFYTFVLGNTKSTEQTLFAVDSFVGVKLGLMILKDYARLDAMDEREYMEAKGIFPSITFEGHAIALKVASVL